MITYLEFSIKISETVLLIAFFIVNTFYRRKPLTTFETFGKLLGIMLLF